MKIARVGNSTLR